MDTHTVISKAVQLLFRRQGCHNGSENQRDVATHRRHAVNRFSVAAMHLVTAPGDSGGGGSGRGGGSGDGGGSSGNHSNGTETIHPHKAIQEE